MHHTIKRIEIWRHHSLRDDHVLMCRIQHMLDTDTGVESKGAQESLYPTSTNVYYFVFDTFYGIPVMDQRQERL